MLLILATACAFSMGFSVNQGSTCAVSAAKQLIHNRNDALLAGFVVTISAAGIVCISSAWLFGHGAYLADETKITVSLGLGAVLLGVGAVVNDACLFGTLARIGRGDVHFLALPAGLAAGFWIAARQHWFGQAPHSPNPLQHPSALGAFVVAVFGILLAGAYLRLARRSSAEAGQGAWPLQRAMLMLGVCGALLFTFVPGWTYADAVRRSVAPDATMTMLGAGAVLAGLAALGGAIVSGLTARSFRYRRPTLQMTGRSFVGGATMAVGATLIPGGNDTLVLATVPAATLGGITAYGIMTATVVILTLAVKQARSYWDH